MTDTTARPAVAEPDAWRTWGDAEYGAWADEVDDQNADMIAAALIQGSQRQGGLARSLSELADVAEPHDYKCPGYKKKKPRKE